MSISTRFALAAALVVGAAATAFAEPSGVPGDEYRNRFPIASRAFAPPIFAGPLFEGRNVGFGFVRRSPNVQQEGIYDRAKGRDN